MTQDTVLAEGVTIEDASLPQRLHVQTDFILATSWRGAPCAFVFSSLTVLLKPIRRERTKKPWSLTIAHIPVSTRALVSMPRAEPCRTCPLDRRQRRRTQLSSTRKLRALQTQHLRIAWDLIAQSANRTFDSSDREGHTYFAGGQSDA